MSGTISLKCSKFKYGGIHRKNQPPLVREHVYSFNSILNTKYIVRAEEYGNDMFIVKFHLKKHTNNKSKYVVLTKENACPYGILLTVLSISFDLLKKNKKASLGFIGSPTKEELIRDENEYLFNTKRFALYTRFASTHFSPDNFVHHEDVKNSSYMMINRKKLAEVPDLYNRILNEFEAHYNISQLFSDLRRELLKPKKKKK